MSTRVPEDAGRGGGGRRVWPLIVAVAVIAVVAAVAVWAFPVFRVSQIEVAGNERVADETVRELTGVPEGENLLRVDAVAAASGVVADPWIRAATVTRRLPSTLQVEVEERTAVAYRDSPDGAVLIDAEGVPFVVGEPPEAAVRITGETDDEAVLAGAVDIAAAISPATREQVAALEAESAHSYTFVLHDGRRVYWGASTDNANKALAMETVLQRGGSEWDVSNPELVTVR